MKEFLALITKLFIAGVRIVHKPGEGVPSVEGLSDPTWEVRFRMIDMTAKKAHKKITD